MSRGKVCSLSLAASFLPAASGQDLIPMLTTVTTLSSASKVPPFLMHVVSMPFVLHMHLIQGHHTGELFR